MFEEYKRNPEITRKRLFFEAMEEIMPGLEVIIQGQDNVDMLYPVKPFDTAEGGGGQ